MQYNTIQYKTIQYNTIQYNTIQCNTICMHVYIICHNEKYICIDLLVIIILKKIIHNNRI